MKKRRSAVGWALPTSLSVAAQEEVGNAHPTAEN